MRPIFHFKESSIHAHLLICFMALAVCKFIEIKTERSIQAVVKMLKGVTDARILDRTNNREVLMRSEIGADVENVLRDILSH